METVISTKDQERKALAKIKEIIEGLGPDSYIGTALEGCLEIAEDNIENDFACSMKQRVDIAVAANTKLYDRIDELEKQLKDSEKDYESAHEAAIILVDEKNAEIARLQAMILAPDDMEDVKQILKDRLTEEEQKVRNAAADIVKHAENPGSVEFKNAVKLHRAYIATVDYTKGLFNRIQKIANN